MTCNDFGSSRPRVTSVQLTKAWVLTLCYSYLVLKQMLHVVERVMIEAMVGSSPPHNNSSTDPH